MTLAHSRSFSAATLRTAIEDVAKHRQVELSAPSALLAELLAAHDDLAQQKWAALREKTDVEDITLVILSDQLVEVCQFLDPIFVNNVEPTAQRMATVHLWR